MDLTDAIQDARLTPGACRVALYVAALGDGWHEVPHSAFAAVLNHPGEKRLRSDLQLAEEFGYLDRKSGGRGHHDRYRVSPALAAPLNGNSPSHDAGLKNSPAPDDTLNGHSPAPEATLRGDSRGVAVEGGVSEGVADSAREGPELSRKAERALDQHEDKLEGCRGSLRDYLAERVPDPTRQMGYVHKVAGWIDGTDSDIWRAPDGDRVDSDRRTAILADALNDLLASDEPDMKRPVGDPANLRTKVKILIAQQEDPIGKRKHQERSDTGSSGRDTRTGLASGLG